MAPRRCTAFFFRNGKLFLGKPKLANNIEATVLESDVSTRHSDFTSDDFAVFCKSLQTVEWQGLLGSLWNLEAGKSWIETLWTRDQIRLLRYFTMKDSCQSVCLFFEKRSAETLFKIRNPLIHGTYATLWLCTDNSRSSSPKSRYEIAYSNCSASGQEEDLSGYVDFSNKAHLLCDHCLLGEWPFL